MFRLFGFDVRVRTGFLVFLGLVLLINPTAFGVWLAAAIAGFTLLHEFGHAVAARSAGAQAAISLDFMAGYTSFRPTRPLTRRQRALISIAGPGSQIVVSLGILAAMGIDPFSERSVRQSDAALAIWWAGPMIGVLNLIPVLPLDGGHLVQTGVEAVLKRPATREMAIASLAITIATAVALAAAGNSRYTLFIAIVALAQVQLIQATSRTPRPDDLLGPATARSPWHRAWAAIERGDAHAARQAILDDLTESTDVGVARWEPPTDAPLDALRSVVATLPPTLPGGNPFSESVLAQVLFATGDVRRAGEYSADGFGRHRLPLMAALVARSACRLGERDNALAWIRAAADAGPQASPDQRAAAGLLLDRASEFDALRDDRGFVEARTALC